MIYTKKVKQRLFGLYVLLIFFPLILLAQTDWIKYQLNPVMGDDLFNGVPAVKPFAIEDKGLFRIIYTGWDMNGKRTISDALSFNGVRWYQLIGSPLLTAGGAGSFDEYGISKACVIKDNDGYKMYYYAENKYPHSIGLATSADGLHWSKYPDNPILLPGYSGAWDDAGVMATTVIYEGGSVYRMYYQGSSGEYANIGYATSGDGINWEKYSHNPVLRHGDSGEFDELTSGEPNIVHAAGRYHLFYTGTNSANRNKIGYAYSLDGFNWAKYNHNPILDAGSSLWEYQCVSAPTVIYKDSIFHMWYSGWCAGQATNIGYAISFLDTTFSGNTANNGYRLEQNYPNPFNFGTQINYNVPRASNVVFKIYDLLGQEVTTLINDKKESGDYTLRWNADGLASGIYFYRIIVDDFTQTKKMVLLK